MSKYKYYKFCDGLNKEFYRVLPDNSFEFTSSRTGREWMKSSGYSNNWKLFLHLFGFGNIKPIREQEVFIEML